MSPIPTGQVLTVTGPIPPDQLGFTLPHEHVNAQLWDFPDVAAANYGGMFGGVYIDEDALADEILAFKERGGATIVDVTPPALRRDPNLLRRLAERTGVAIVMGSGWYRQPFYPVQDLIDRRTVDDLARALIDEVERGVDGTGITPGILGEFGVNNSWVSAQEERVHRAAARAQKVTGLALTTHSPWTSVGLLQLQIFEEEGVDPARVAIGHSDSYPVIGYYLNILERGAYVQFDNIGEPTFAGPYEERLIGIILELLDRGHAERILFSHDVWNYKHFRYYGGTGYTYLHDTFLPRLRKEGVERTSSRPSRSRTPGAC